MLFCQGLAALDDPDPATKAFPATGTESMAETPLKQPLKAILETIRERADCALKQLQAADEQRSMHWRCKECRREALYSTDAFGVSRKMSAM
jgi:hypothetical protein